MFTLSLPFLPDAFTSTADRETVCKKDGVENPDRHGKAGPTKADTKVPPSRSSERQLKVTPP